MVADRLTVAPVRSSRTAYDGAVFRVDVDEVDLGDAGVVTRDVVRHTGAVAVVALDDDGRVALVDQYRHAVGARCYEVPAGLLDVSGEDPAVAARRELAEEADLVAGRLDVLVDFFTTPGMTDESIRVYLARDLSPVPEGERHVREAEEASMSLTWIPLDAAVDAVLAGDLHNPSTCLGVLAAARSRDGGWASLRPADSPWPTRTGAPRPADGADPADPAGPDGTGSDAADDADGSSASSTAGESR